ncbi:unnamed protein product [Aureobasidium uvarum]|uniref:CBM-cenC domain-containing protein n=1 Tax=Aureobasidium uvarum TaxID=2773716 RepID=A0A9N8KXN6_9PEZI|nr:unnamed protein product [Aureobasidium uvarum]
MWTATLIGTLTLGLSAVALPTADNPIDLHRRQDINFTLADAVADASVISDGSSNAAGIAAVVADINANPLPQNVDKRDASGYSASTNLNNVAINAPLNCNGADTYMGSKMWNDPANPFLENRCAAACTAQSAYNLAHPPSNGSPKLCQFYNTYLLLKNGVSQGQYCSLYTQAWDSSKATNNGQWRGTDHYTISNSVVASNATNTGDVSCPQDVPYLSANGQAFCTAYLSYVPPVVTITAMSTPATSVVTSVDTDYTTETSYSTTTTLEVSLSTTVSTIFQKRDLATPASAISWSPSRLSKACAAVATGSTTTTTVQIAPTPLSTYLTTVSLTTTSLIQSTTTISSVSTVVDTFSPTATSLGANLVVNGDFETKFAGEWQGPVNRCNNGGYRIGNQAYAAFDGTAYGEFYYYASNVCPATLIQTISGLSSSNRYTLSYYLWPRTANPGSVCSFSVTLGGILIDSFTPTTYINRPQTYVKHKVSGIVPSSSAGAQELAISLWCSDGDAVYVDFDDISLQQEGYS